MMKTPTQSAWQALRNRRGFLHDVYTGLAGVGLTALLRQEGLADVPRNWEPGL
ncbi:MAG TPA: DUF1501 domain-containing protein, partial [Verrucomicrobiales bacterium]|nr:DUF1501 domain-containing protein [Verrucomicrobiales bacterium]